MTSLREPLEYYSKTCFKLKFYIKLKEKTSSKKKKLVTHAEVYLQQQYKIKITKKTTYTDNTLIVYCNSEKVKKHLKITYIHKYYLKNLTSIGII